MAPILPESACKGCPATATWLRHSLPKSEGATVFISASPQRPARLLSVNVGLPREIEWRGRTVRTAIWKEAVQGRRRVKRLNVEGDGQADLGGHGGEQRAVFVYQIESYRYWAERLGRRDFTHGQVGENFTSEGLPDDEGCMGYRCRGRTAPCAVTLPRVTVYRVGMRANEPQLAGPIAATGRP